MGAGTTLVAGKVFSGKCASQNYFYCAAAITAAAQVIQYAVTAKDSKRTYDATNCVNGACASGYEPPNFEYPEFKDPGFNEKLPPVAVDVIGDSEDEAKGIIDDLGDRGYSYNPGTGKVTTPNGKQIDPKKLTTAAGAASQGMSASDFESFKETLEEAKLAANKRAKELRNLFKSSDVGVDGGSGGKRAVARRGSRDFGPNYDFLKGLINRKKSNSNVAGLTQQHGGEPIGVAADNIFDMVSRKYDNKEVQGAFLTNKALKSRNPASVNSRWYIKKIH